MIRYRDHEGVAKDVNGGGDKSLVRKRGANESTSGRGKKRKIIAAAKADGEGSQEHVMNAAPDKVFRFMELPGGTYTPNLALTKLEELHANIHQELRNRIYAHAEEYSHRCFPPLYPKKSKSKSQSTTRSRSSRSSALSTTNSEPNLKPLPHIGLTQTNSLIRSEFRPAWLSTHKIPLSLLPTYLKAFYPPPKPNTSPSLQQKLDSQSRPNGSLRLLIRESEIPDIDIIPIIRHAARFPSFSLTCLGMPGVDAALLASIQGVLDNKTEAWTRDVREKRVTQLRLMANGRSRARMRIVVKERWAEEWMKEGITKDDLAGEYVRSRGLEGTAEFWRVAFGVEYT